MPAFVIPTRCQYVGHKRGRTTECHEDGRFIGPDGEVVTLLMYQPHSGRFIGPCHVASVSKTLAEQFAARWPGFPTGYSVYVPTAAEDKLEANRQRWMRHALEEVAAPRVGGLVRQDNSGMLGWSLRRVR